MKPEFAENLNLPFITFKIIILIETSHQFVLDRPEHISYENAQEFLEFTFKEFKSALFWAKKQMQDHTVHAQKCLEIE